MGIRTEVENLVHALRGATEEPGEDAMLTAIKDDIAQVNTNITALNTKLDTLNTLITDLNTKLASIDYRLS